MSSLVIFLLTSSLPLGTNNDPGAKAASQSAAPPAAEAKPEEEKPSLAERIARLQSGIEQAQKQLEAFKAQLKDDPTSEYQQALQAFQLIDAKMQNLQKQIDMLTKEGKKQEAATLEQERKELEGKHHLAKERFNLAIQERKMLQQKIKNLPEKIQQDQEALDELLGKSSPRVKNGKETPPKAQPPNAADPDAGAEKTPPKTEGKPEEPPPVQPGVLPVPLPNPAASLLPKAPAENKELKQAQKDAKTKQEEAKKAKIKAESVAKRLEVLRKNIKIDEGLLLTASKKVQHLEKELNQLEKEKEKLLADGKWNEANKLLAKIAEADQRLDRAQDEMSKLSANLANMRHQQADLLKDRHLAVMDAAKKKHEAQKAQERVAELQNPFTLRNLIQWSIDRGPSLLTILVGIVLLRYLSRLTSGQIVKMISRSGRRFSIREAENRAQTLAGIFNNVASLLIVGGGTLMILDLIGLPIVPLLGGAAVFGLAVAFGAQNLIRDYFTGFMILMEDQYGINDVVKIGDIAGRVERITMRITVLRDLEGVVHFVPHGTITNVSNRSHGWSVALFDIGVAYKEDADRVMQVLLDLGKDLRLDPGFGSFILEDPEMLGVDSFDDSAVVIKFLIKTKPLKQWLVKREMLRRIKNRFDELGIEIPFPHRTVYHRQVEGHSHPEEARPNPDKWVA